MAVYADGMVEHDGMVGQILAEIEKLGIQDNTIVMYSTDNGAETFTWPDGGTTMFRGEKNTNWEGGYRVPTFIRWPGVIKPGTVINEIGTHEDMLPTLVAAAGDPNVKDELLAGKELGGKTYKVHIDGNNLMPALKGEAEWPTKSFIYWTDDGSVAALRFEDWKVTFLEQEAEGLRVWQDPFKVLRAPLLTNLRMDPFERAEHENAMGYQRWYMERMFAMAPAGAYVGALAAKLQGVPAAPEARQLQPGKRDELGHVGQSGQPVTPHPRARRRTVLCHARPCTRNDRRHPAPQGGVPLSFNGGILDASPDRRPRLCCRPPLGADRAACPPGPTARTRPRSSTSSRA